MARLVLSLLVLSLALCMAGKTESASSPTDFIRESCRATRYFDLCVQSLSCYAGSIGQNDKNLATIALKVSLASAKAVKSLVTKMAKVKGIKGREYQAVKDCIENMSDSVDQLSQSIQELGRIGQATGRDFEWHISNVQTWVSAALTDDDTCLDGLSGIDGKVKGAIRPRVDNVSEVTSNGLALVNWFAARHRSAAASEQP